MTEALRQAAENAADVLDEARTYVGCESWSPSMLEECERALRMLRAALAQPPAPTAQPAESTTGQPLRSICWANCPCRKTAQPVQQPGAEPVACWGVEACVNGAWTLQWPPRMTREVALADRNAYIPNTLLRVRPLYFGAAPAQRQPLSEVQIHAMKCAAADQGITGIAPSLHLARAIEAAHGITAAPAAQKGEKL